MLHINRVYFPMLHREISMYKETFWFTHHGPNVMWAVTWATNWRKINGPGRIRTSNHWICTQPRGAPWPQRQRLIQVATGPVAKGTRFCHLWHKSLWCPQAHMTFVTWHCDWAIRECKSFNDWSVKGRKRRFDMQVMWVRCLVGGWLHWLTTPTLPSSPALGQVLQRKSHHHLAGSKSAMNEWVQCVHTSCL